MALGLVALLGALHFVAIEFYFYWTLWWYDLMMHTLAGFSGGLIVLWFLRSLDNFIIISLVLISVMIAGVAYEVFEYIYDIIPPGNYWQDTIFDIVSDGVGAILACLYAMGGRTPKSVSELPAD